METLKAKYSYIAKVKKGSSIIERKFNSFSSTVASAKEDLENWFYATHQKVEIINIVKA